MSTTMDKSREPDDSEWLVKLRSPLDIIIHHPDLLKLELCSFLCAILTFIHAWRSGGRYMYLWTAVILQGLYLELVSYWTPQINNYWHAQGMVMLLGQRLPLYILCIYTLFAYTPCIVVAHSEMKWWAQPFGVGLTAWTLDLPLETLNAKNLFWTWHDSDPNIRDRMYGVPWTNFLFFLSGFGSFHFVFHALHWLLSPGQNTYHKAGYKTELVCVLVSSVMGFPLSVLHFTLVYHPLHDVYKIHGEVCILALALFYGLVVWLGTRQMHTATSHRKRLYVNEILVVVLLVNFFSVYLAITSTPEKIISTGFHEPVGSCNETEPLYTPIGLVLLRRKYLCLNEYNDKYFDFRCARQLPVAGEHWYTICGKLYENRAETTFVVCCMCTLCITWCVSLLCTGELPAVRNRQKHHIKQN